MSADEKNEQGVKKSMLAVAVTEAMAERKWSLASAEIATGIGRGTIHNMRRGVRVRPEQVVAFAKAVAKKGEETETVERFLSLFAADNKAAGSEYLKSLRESSSGFTFQNSVSQGIISDVSTEIERIPDGQEPVNNDILPIHAEGLKDLDSIQRAAIALMLETNARAMVDAFKTDRAASSIGGGMSPQEKAKHQSDDDEFQRKLDERMNAEVAEYEADKFQ